MNLGAIGAIAGGGLGLYNAYQQREKQIKFAKEQRKILVSNFNENINSLRKSFEYHKENAGYDLFQNKIDEVKNIANTTISASSSGFGGTSVFEAIDNIKLSSEFTEDKIRRNLDIVAENMDTQSYNLYSDLKANINSLKQGQTNLLDVLQGGISGGIQGYQIGSKL